MARLLLTALLLQRNQPVSADRLFDVLWGGEPPRSAAASLHNHVLRLRRALGPQGPQRLKATPAGFRLEVREGELDSAVFTDHVQRARTAHRGRDWPEVGRRTSAALALWRGDPLAEFPGLADSQEARYLTELRFQALEWHLDAELAAGRHHGLTAELTRLVADHPLREAYHRQLMTALHRDDRTPEALAVYRSLRRTLVDQVGVEPSTAVQQLHQLILADHISSDPAPGRSAPIHRRVTRRTLRPFQLPADCVSFVGRHEELRTLRDRLATSSVSGPSIVVISGMGGIGKTALAVHLAHEERADFPDGLLYTDMRGFGVGNARTAHELLARFMVDLGLPGGSVPNDPDDRSALYRATLADRRILLVLDNVRETAQVTDLLPGPGRSAVIVTSRHRLPAFPNATHVGLGALDRVSQRNLLAVHCGITRINEDPDSADQILAACDGIPLALQIVGARLKSRPDWPLKALAQRLSSRQHRLAALTADHLSMRGSLRFSYRALLNSPHGLERDAARAFRRLGVRRCTPISAHRAADILNESPGRTVDLLTCLVDAHLLEVTPGCLYRFQDLVREFAAELAEHEEPVAGREPALRSPLLH